MAWGVRLVVVAETADYRLSKQIPAEPPDEVWKKLGEDAVRQMANEQQVALFQEQLDSGWEIVDMGSRGHILFRRIKVGTG